MTPAITVGTTIALKSFESRPVRVHRVSATLAATSTPIASISPYAQRQRTDVHDAVLRARYERHRHGSML